ncbi:unnamed protein product [Alopecurus aequalis]
MDSWWREDFTAFEEKLVEALGRKQQGQPLPRLSPCALYDLDVLAFHPQQICDEYKNPAGDGAHVYFFSPRDMRLPVPDDGETRPPRTTADGGVWKICGGIGNIRREPGVIIGHKAILVLYTKGSNKRSEWGMDEFTTPGNQGPADICLRRVYKRDERWDDEQRRRQSSAGMKEKLLLRLRARLAGAPALLEKKERELDLAFTKYWNSK